MEIVLKLAGAVKFKQDWLRQRWEQEAKAVPVLKFAWSRKIKICPVPATLCARSGNEFEMCMEPKNLYSTCFGKAGRKQFFCYVGTGIDYVTHVL